MNPKQQASVETHGRSGTTPLKYSVCSALPSSGARSAPREDANWDGATLPDLAREHDKLIGQILAEEEELIASHRGHVDAMVRGEAALQDCFQDVAGGTRHPKRRRRKTATFDTL